jgi:hypothetical protein
VINLKKPNKKELLITLIICILLFTATALVNQPKQPAYSNTAAMQPNFLTDQTKELTQQYGLSDNWWQPQQSQTSAYDERIRDIKQWIKGELKKGTFEDVVMEIEAQTQENNGYIESEDVTFTDDTWTGEIVSKIPQNRSLQFVFEVRKLISDSGKVTSITTNIRDITPASETTIQKPLAQIRVTLKEISDKPWQPQLPNIQLPIFNAIIPLLSTFFTWILVGIIIGLPAYFTVLGLVLLIDRALKPVTTRLLKKT